MYMLSTVISQTGECNAQHATDPCFLNQWGYSTLLLIIIGIGLVYLLFKKRKFLVDNLKWIAGTVFIAGFLIYWYAFNEGGSDSNSIALAFRSALSSMEMFASHSDLLEVRDTFPGRYSECGFYHQTVRIQIYLMGAVMYGESFKKEEMPAVYFLGCQ